MEPTASLELRRFVVLHVFFLDKYFFVLGQDFYGYGLRSLGMSQYCNMDYVSVIVICDIGAIPSNDAYQQYMSTGQV